MKQNRIRITENELKQIVAESVKKVLNEGNDIENNTNTDKDDFRAIFSIRAYARKILSIVDGLDDALRNGRLEDYETVRGFIPQVIRNLRFVADNIEDHALMLKRNNNFKV